MVDASSCGSRAFGRDFGTTNAEYVPRGSERVGRQSKTWMHTERGWQIVSAHVSFLGDGRYRPVFTGHAGRRFAVSDSFA